MEKNNRVINEGQLYDFVKLIKRYKIEIPIIQRDYAQGRADKSEVRINFLNAIVSALVNEKPLNLDFIYGSIENNVLQPLDGQQRLTTLFLLHWYALIIDSENNTDYYNLLRKFTYETRTSSREFCNALVDNKISLDNDDDKISKQIENMPWYFLSWRKDPTIDAMLRTLDDIQAMFKSVSDLKTKLFGEVDYINFYYIELDNFGLNDDLYIKMNARGKALTTFENFKASFEKLIHDKGWEKRILLDRGFAFKVDTIWTDMLWKHRNQNNDVDKPFLRIFSTVLMISYAIGKSENRLAMISKIQRDSELIRAQYFTKGSYTYLVRVMDIYHSVYKKGIDLTLDFPFWQHLSTNNIFDTILNPFSTPSYTQKVLFFAQTEYLISNELDNFNKEKFIDWMRIIRNLVSLGSVSKTGSRPAIVRSPDSFAGMIQLINELSKFNSDIYKELPELKIKSTFAREQVEEERQKARLINFSKTYKELLWDAEDRNLLMGRIGIIFDIMAYDNIPKNFDFNRFHNLTEIFKEYFDNDITDKIRRGLLCIPDLNGNHNYYNYWWSYSYTVDAEKRCLIGKYRELEYFIYGGYKERQIYRQYFIKLVNKLEEDDLDSIISNFTKPDGMPNWKYKLIKDETLLRDHCDSKYIAIDNNNEYIYLLKGVRPRTLKGCYKITNS